MLLPSLSHHFFTRFAASNASEASLEPVENEESSMTSQMAFNKMEEDRQLVDNIIDEIEWTLTRLICLWAWFLTYVLLEMRTIRDKIVMFPIPVTGLYYLCLEID